MVKILIIFLIKKITVKIIKIKKFTKNIKNFQHYQKSKVISNLDPIVNIQLPRVITFNPHFSFLKFLKRNDKNIGNA